MYHESDTATYGHYYIDIKNSADQCWYRHNNASTTKITLDSIFNPTSQVQVYCLVYKMVKQLKVPDILSSHHPTIKKESVVLDNGKVVEEE